MSKDLSKDILKKQSFTNILVKDNKILLKKKKTKSKKMVVNNRRILINSLGLSNANNLKSLNKVSLF